MHLQDTDALLLQNLHILTNKWKKDIYEQWESTLEAMR